MAKTRKAQAKRSVPTVSGRQKKALVGRKRFKASSGGYARMAVLDANDDNFGNDLLRVFRENVAKARKENKRLFGSADRVPEDN
jgi:hypothetical protein